MKRLFVIFTLFVLMVGNIYAQQLNLDTVIERSARAVEEVLPRDGIHSFFPRLRAHRGGVDQNAYIDRITVRGSFMNIFLISTPAGVTTA